MHQPFGIPFGPARRLAPGLALGAVALAACGVGASSGGAGSGYAANGTPAPSSTARPQAQSVVEDRQTSLGSVLTDRSGRTLYLFEKDAGGTSACYGACATFWPPVLAPGAVHAAGHAAAAALATVTRHDGSHQVTYAGHPLYYFSGDRGPGSVTGEGLTNFGGGWYAVSPKGQKIDND